MNRDLTAHEAKAKPWTVRVELPQAGGRDPPHGPLSQDQEAAGFECLAGKAGGRDGGWRKEEASGRVIPEAFLALFLLPAPGQRFMGG